MITNDSLYLKTNILANKTRSKFVVYNFWEPDYKNKSLLIKSHVPNTQL